MAVLWLIYHARNVMVYLPDRHPISAPWFTQIISPSELPRILGADPGGQGSAYGAYKQECWSSLEVRQDNRTKFSDSTSNIAVKGKTSQSHLSVEVSEQASGRQQLGDFKHFPPQPDLVKHGAPFILPKALCGSPSPSQKDLRLCIPQVWTSFLLRVYFPFQRVPRSGIITLTGKGSWGFKTQISCCCSGS